MHAMFGPVTKFQFFVTFSFSKTMHEMLSPKSGNLLMVSTSYTFRHMLNAMTNV